jgi:hypothetical protein
MLKRVEVTDVIFIMQSWKHEEWCIATKILGHVSVSLFPTQWGRGIKGEGVVESSTNPAYSNQTPSLLISLPLFKRERERRT